MKIIKVFPRRTKATPDDGFCRGPELFDQADEVHLSVTFTWDIPAAEELERQWRNVAPVKVGGPAIGTRGEEFSPGMYLKEGYTITSRGCPNRCWFCTVPKRDGDIRELPIKDGWNVLDDNLLACSDEHIENVFTMLGRQKTKAEFTGGLEAKLLKKWQAKRMKTIKTKQAFFAYDTEDDFEPLAQATKMMLDAGFTKASHSLRCYVLVGYPKDTFDLAEFRMKQVCGLGLTPMGMLWRDRVGTVGNEWRQWQRKWARPAIIHGGVRP